MLHDLQERFDERMPLLGRNTNMVVRFRGRLGRGQVLLIRRIVVTPNKKSVRPLDSDPKLGRTWSA